MVCVFGVGIFFWCRVYREGFFALLDLAAWICDRLRGLFPGRGDQIVPEEPFQDAKRGDLGEPPGMACPPMQVRDSLLPCEDRAVDRLRRKASLRRWRFENFHPRRLDHNKRMLE